MTTIDQKIVEIINENLTTSDGWPWGNLLLCVIALVLSVLLCGLIGLEREKRGRSAGLRTHLLVGVGSCIIMIISIYGFPSLFGEKRDVARLAAQAVTGVGFLGAGVIVHRGTGGGVKGLTTAATIWIVMAIGIACGSFNFILAILGTALIGLVLVFFKKIEIKVSKGNPVIILTAPGDKPLLNTVLSLSQKYDCTVHGLSTEIVEINGEKQIQMTFQAIFASGEDRVLEYLSALEKETSATAVHLLGHR